MAGVKRFQDQQTRAEELARRTNGATTAFLKDRTEAARRQKRSKGTRSRNATHTPNPPEDESPEGAV
jgi:hypothetical protein